MSDPRFYTVAGAFAPVQVSIRRAPLPPPRPDGTRPARGPARVAVVGGDGVALREHVEAAALVLNRVGLRDEAVPGSALAPPAPPPRWSVPDDAVASAAPALREDGFYVSGDE